MPHLLYAGSAPAHRRAGHTASIIAFSIGSFELDFPVWIMHAGFLPKYNLFIFYSSSATYLMAALSDNKENNFSYILYRLRLCSFSFQIFIYTMTSL